MQTLNLKVKGLYTYPNQLGSATPEGALAEATNCVIDADSVAQTRRGLNRLNFTLPLVSDRAEKLFSYQDKLLASWSGDSFGYYDTSTGWQIYSGTYQAIDTLARIRAATSNQNFYFTTEAGVKKLDVYNSTPTAAGMYKGLDITATLNAAAGGFLATANQVAYRHVWGIKDANNNLITGAPSQRTVVVNGSGGNKDVDLAITIPAGITTAHFLQVYRSPQSGGASIEPSDEVQLVYEVNPTSGQIAAESLSFTDQTPDSLRGATLYTSPSEEGILEANEIPPQAKDIAYFNNSVFYANTVSKQRLNITIISVGGANGIALNDTITIAGVTYTAKSSETVASGYYKLSTGGTPAQNIADTANSLVRVINQSALTTTVYAYYLSGTDDLPGQILLEERGFGASSYAVTASAHSGAFNPSLPTSGTSVSSTNDAFKNAVYFSKSDLPEAVPLINNFRIGSAAKAILRIIPLRDSLFVLKEDGCWRILGVSPANFRVEAVDLSTHLLAPETAVALNNQIYCLSDQGVVTITETGVSVISRPIEGDLLELFGKDINAVKQYSFAVGYDTDRKFILFTIKQGGDTTARQAYVYNVFTNAWTNWDLSKTCGIINPADGKLYLGDSDTAYVNVERKNFNYTDYVDQAGTLTLVSHSGYNITVNDVTGVTIGDLIYQSSTVNSVVESINTDTNTLTMRDSLSGWIDSSTLTLYQGITSTIEWLPCTGGNPGTIKNFQETTIFFLDNRFDTISFGFKTDFSPAYENVSVVGAGGGLWGLIPWGSGPFGGSTVAGPSRTEVPLNKSRGSVLTVRLKARLAFQKFAIEGISIPFTTGNYWVNK